MRLEEKCEIIEIKLDIHIAVRRQSMGRRSHAATALWLGEAEEVLDQRSEWPLESKAVSRVGPCPARLPPQSKR